MIRTTTLAFLCCGAIGCSSAGPSGLGASGLAPPEPGPSNSAGQVGVAHPKSSAAPDAGAASPELNAGTAPSAPDDASQPLPIVAITDAPIFPLRARKRGDSLIEVLLPPERAHLLNVDITLLVIHKETEQILAQEKQQFNRNTQGAVLHFFLPTLPQGDMVAEIRSVATVQTGSGATAKQAQFYDKAQVSFKSVGPPPARFREFRFHFEVQHSANAAPVLVQDEAKKIVNEIERLKVVLTNNEVVSVQLDCWASTDGSDDLNDKISTKRCGWVDKEIVRKALPTNTSTQVSVNAHGEHNLPVPQPWGIKGSELSEIQKKNRVAILRVFISK